MICDEGVSALTQWKQQLLNDVGIFSPDGRPLYAYRLSEAQFESLEAALRGQIQRYSTLGSLSQSNRSFDSLFVLYAAEWWRRRNDGSRWSWEPILADIGACNMGWTAGQRGECITRGLRGWNLKPIETSGLRYLGSVAVQGGLPMQLLAEAKGNLGRMLRKVLKLAAGGAEFRQIRSWIESLNDYLPKSYQRVEIYVLLAEVISTVLNLKGEAKLTASSDALAQLDQRVPGWRTRFPLPVEDGEIQGLIEQLIRDVTEVQVNRSACTILAERWLNNKDNDIWTLYSSIDLPDVLNIAEIRLLFGIDDEYSLPRSFELILGVADYQRALVARKIAGHEAYRLERCPRELGGGLALAEHRLSLRMADGRRWSATARKGEPLSTDLPWVFECTPEQSPRLIRQGGGGVQAAEALVAIPADATIDQSSGDACELVAFMELPEREIYSISGTVVVKDRFGRRCTIRTGRADAAEESFQWSGDRVWLEFIRPSYAFRGKPSLQNLYGEEGVQRVPDRSLSWTPSSDISGSVTVCYEEKGELRHQTQIVLLPHDAAVEFQPVDASRGTIHLRHWQLASANLAEGAGAEIKLKHEGDTLLIQCTSLQSVSPEWLELELAWEQNTKPARIRLPFPAEGARAFDASGADLAADSWVSVQRLAGVRLVSFCHSYTPVELCLRLRHTKERENEHEVRHRIRPVTGVSRLDIRLQDYAEDIEHLLAADELLDAWVEVALYINNHPSLSIRVSRYECRLERLGTSVLITNQHLKNVGPDVLELLPVYALRLEQPGDEAIVLVCNRSEGVPNGSWEFAPEAHEPGAWLIYPGPESVLAFRPTLWLVPGDAAATTSLAKALAIENRFDRAGAMDEVIASMAVDFLDPGWADLERLAGHLGHLPLVTLDVWRRFVHSPVGMAALALRMSNLPDGFLRRFSLEQPFAWELVPLQAWLDASRHLNLQSIALFGEEFGQREFGKLLNGRVEELSTYYPALGYLLSFVKSVALENDYKDVRQPGVDGWFKNQLFSGEESALRRLFRDHADDKWLSDSNIFYAIETIRKERKTSHLFLGESYNFKDTTIGLPILLAIQASMNCTYEWFEHPERIHTLRTYMAFDPDWFAKAFDITIARCLSNGIVQL